MIKRPIVLKQNPLTFSIGKVQGIVIAATNSRKSCMELVKQEEGGSGEHMSLICHPELTWQEANIVASNLTLLWQRLCRRRPAIAERIVHGLYPHLAGVPLSELACRVIGNDEMAAWRDTIHAHIVIAKISTWRSNMVPRIVDPLVPVPPEKRTR